MKKYPAFFFGHWSPLNAILDTPFSREWEKIGKTLEKPKAIISISAHFERQGTYITAMNSPKTIYDFSWFPEELYQVHYPMKWSQKIANEIIEYLGKDEIFPDYSWWIDHGTWTILKFLFPSIWDIPVLQISLDMKKTSQEHFNFAKKLHYLREKWYLIMWSGNIVHNLYKIDWYNENNIFQWAQEVNNEVKSMLLSWDIEKLFDFIKLWPKYNMAIPTHEHFLPIFYIYALKWGDEKIEFFNEWIVHGSLSMDSFKIF